MIDRVGTNELRSETRLVAISCDDLESESEEEEVQLEVPPETIRELAKLLTNSSRRREIISSCG